MPSVIVVGGGLAGLATAAALGSAGFEVDLFEARGFLGGRATSYPAGPENAEVIDNCQHVLLRCCVNLLDLYRRLDVDRDITFYKEFYFVEPGGRTSVLRAGSLPKPLHFASSFLRMSCFSLRDKISLARGLQALERERGRTDLDSISMLDWLREKKQTAGAIDRYWRQVLVSAINEELDKMAASHGFQVFWLGFLASKNSHEMGIPNVPLGKLYGSDAWKRFPGVRIHLRSTVERFDETGVQVNGEMRQADSYVFSVPFERLNAMAPQLNAPKFEHSPITGIHLWFDRTVTHLPHAVLLDRTVQWMFNKDSGRYIQLVVSASRSLLEMPRNEVIELGVRELAEFCPEAQGAKLLKAHVVKEVRATFSAAPGLELLRPQTRTKFSNVFLAGDWTRSGWPATMEGAVRSGYLAAEAVAGTPGKFLLPDIA